MYLKSPGVYGEGAITDPPLRLLLLSIEKGSLSYGRRSVLGHRAELPNFGIKISFMV